MTAPSFDTAAHAHVGIQQAPQEELVISCKDVYTYSRVLTSQATANSCTMFPTAAISAVDLPSAQRSS